MNIFSYYFPVPGKPTEEEHNIINLWKLSWSLEKFIPKVLVEGDAKLHSFYDEFTQQIEDIHFKVMNEPLGEYGLSCWVRWLAYATIRDPHLSPFYVSDYDLINYNYKNFPPSKKLTLFNSHCPCIASGSYEQFDDLASLFIDLSNKNIDKIIKEKKEKNFGCYHDQEFIEIFHSVLIDQYNIDIIYPYHPRHLGCFPSLYGKQHCAALHFSNRAMQDLKDQSPYYANSPINNVRIKHIKKVLGIDL